MSNEVVAVIPSEVEDIFQDGVENVIKGKIKFKVRNKVVAVDKATTEVTVKGKITVESEVKAVEWGINKVAKAVSSANEAILSDGDGAIKIIVLRNVEGGRVSKTV